MVDRSGNGLPVLSQWMDGVPTHPLRWYFEAERPSRYRGAVHAWWRSPILTAIEETLAILERVQPDGLLAKRQDFRGFWDQSAEGMELFLTHRAELTVASHLAESGVPFRFNGGEGPDLLLDAGEMRFGIEVSSRRPKSLDSLTRELRAGLQARGMPAVVTTSTDPIPPVAIREKVRREIIEAFLPSDGGPGVTSMRVEAAPARPEDGIPAAWVTIRVTPNESVSRMAAPYNSPHMIATAQEVARNVLREPRAVRGGVQWPRIRRSGPMPRRRCPRHARRRFGWLRGAGPIPVAVPADGKGGRMRGSGTREASAVLERRRAERPVRKL
ncbi:hypothetical protein [Streptomyces sp. NBC_01294]|uniref:hypothetical protein n=1 Tax=Streptomyces sp. NBC_01294 TaxID=2903815 RepID=UPI002DD82D3B|nr:hypothetical protein [Streptomyces sp. NBC_01294]WRZ58099.1 hypothetical protein OG534_17300 [Streptomyces sp. NBC_01294]